MDGALYAAKLPETRRGTHTGRLVLGLLARASGLPGANTWACVVWVVGAGLRRLVGGCWEEARLSRCERQAAPASRVRQVRGSRQEQERHAGR